jgi:hypothetical protein
MYYVARVNMSRIDLTWEVLVVVREECTGGGDFRPEFGSRVTSRLGTERHYRTPGRSRRAT